MNVEHHGRLCECAMCQKNFRFPLTERFDGDIYNESYFLNHGPYDSQNLRERFFILEDSSGALENQILDNVLCEHCFLKQLLKDFISYGHIMDVEIELFVEHMMEQDSNKQEIYRSYQKKR